MACNVALLWDFVSLLWHNHDKAIVMYLLGTT